MNFGPVGEPIAKDGACGYALGVDGVSADFGEVIVDEPREGARLVANEYFVEFARRFLGLLLPTVPL